MAITNRWIIRGVAGAILLMGLLLGGQLPAGAESLWSDQGTLFVDHKAHTVGDTLTILISESSSASRVGKASNAKSGSVSNAAGAGIFHFLASASASGQDSSSSSGSITNSNSVTGKITVQVTGVKPNGNLLISGTQFINQNGEEQKIIITGEVRPDDVTSDNTVLSSYVANAQIKIDGKGPIADKQHQGILTQIFNFLF